MFCNWILWHALLLARMISTCRSVPLGSIFAEILNSDELRSQARQHILNGLVTGDLMPVIDRTFYNIAIRRGAAMIDATCASGPHTAFYAYGMAPQWTTRTLNEGDIFHCDMYGAAVEGYTWDFSRSVVAGGKWSAAQNDVYDGAIEAINAGIAACRPAVTAEELWKAVGDVLDTREISCGYPLHGHSYGIGWESPWLVPGNDTPVTAGMAIALECMAGREDTGYVKFEQNILVHEDRTELISTCPVRV